MPDVRQYPRSLAMALFLQNLANGSGPSQTDHYQYNWVDQFVGTQNPQWRNQVKNVLGASTNADGTELIFHSVPFIDSAIHYNTGFNDFYYFRVGNPGNVLPSLPVAGAPLDVVSRVTSRAITQFLDKARSELSSFESGQDLGEIKQTIESILHPMKSLKQHVLSYFSSAKKLKNKYKKAHDLKKALSDTYLEWTFGWNPLIHDIADGIAGLTHIRLPYNSIESFAKEKFQHDVWGVIDSSGISSGGFYAKTLVTGEFSVRFKGVVNSYYQGGPPSVQDELRLAPRDFIPTAWDLLPYSFIVDYFINVGDIINAYAFPSAALRWVNMSSRDQRILIQDYVKTYDNIDPRYLVSFAFESTSLKVEAKTFSRRNFLPSDLVPNLQISLPFSIKPWENISALLASRSKPLLPLW